MNRMYEAAGNLTSVGWQMYEMILHGGNCIDVVRERLPCTSECVCVIGDGDDGEVGIANLN